MNSKDDRRSDVMGGSHEPTDVIDDNEEPARDRPDVMSPGPEPAADILEGGEEPAGEDPDLMDGGQPAEAGESDEMRPPPEDPA